MPVDLIKRFPMDVKLALIRRFQEKDSPSMMNEKKIGSSSGTMTKPLLLLLFKYCLFYYTVTSAWMVASETTSEKTTPTTMATTNVSSFVFDETSPSSLSRLPHQSILESVSQYSTPAIIVHSGHTSSSSRVITKGITSSATTVEVTSFSEEVLNSSQTMSSTSSSFSTFNELSTLLNMDDYFPEDLGNQTVQKW